MTKIISKFSFLFLLFCVFFINCSKDDSDGSQPIDQNGGEVFRSQVVALSLPNVTLTQDEYQGTLGGVPITLMKAEEGKLLFFVPSATVLGLNDLLIPSINNATVHYDIKETVLTETVEETVAPLFLNIDTFSQTLDTSPEGVAEQNSLNSFQNAFDNASAEDKMRIAVLYKVNKAMFDDVFLNDYSSGAGKFVTSATINLIWKHSLSIIAMYGGAHIAVYGVGVEKLLGLAVVGAGAYKAVDFFKQLAGLYPDTIGVAVNAILGTNNRDTNATVITFQNDVNKRVPFSINESKLVTGDAVKTKPQVVLFFKYYNIYNEMVTKVNIAVQWVNNNIPFANFSLIPKQQLPVTSPQISTDVTTAIFSKIQFRVSHPNLQLVSASLEATGQLNLKIKIIGNPAPSSVESFLNYSYDDEFSTFSGKIPLKVNLSNSLEGSWSMVTWQEGISVGDYYYTYPNENCPTLWIAKETYSGTIQFAEGTVNSTTYRTVVNSGLLFDSSCQIIYNGGEVTETTVENKNGTYHVYNGNQYYITFEDTTGGSIEFITPDRIKINGAEYVRQ